MPHEYVPWTEGLNFAGVFEDGVPWDVTQSKVSDTARTALVVNLLTEDNLPSYHREIYQSFGPEGAWGTWIGRWTAEEGRHGMAIRDYLLTSRAVDPDALERERIEHMTQGFQSSYELDMLHTVAYVSFQELATRISHRNTGKYTEDPFADQLLARISVDENLHMVFYRNLIAAAFEIAPDETMAAVRDEVIGFKMPGANMPDFLRNSVTIAKAGIYDLRLHHDAVISPVLKFWNVFGRDDLGPAGEQAREELARFVSQLDAQASRFVEQRERARAKAAARTT
jgi:acyl-[acyl-carrier-protein] desaturase